MISSTTTLVTILFFLHQLCCLPNVNAIKWSNDPSVSSLPLSSPPNTIGVTHDPSWSLLMEPSVDEKNALVDLWNGTQGGTKWINNYNWLEPSTTPCTWYGIHCNAMHGHIDMIDLAANGLTGVIPRSIFTSLKWLTLINLSWNSITTTLSYYCNFNLLESLSLDSLGMVGEIPSCLSSLPLHELNIQLNHLTGSIPSSFNNLVAMRNLNVASNALIGTIPDLSSLTSMVVFDAADNAGLNGTVPDWICKWVNMKSFTFSDSQITGQLPLCLHQLIRLESLWVPRNLLTGILPSLPPNLVTLNVEQNHIGGDLLDINNILGLQFARLSNNDFTGEWPIHVTLANLTFLDLSTNKLWGQLPTNLSLPLLTELDISNNTFSGDLDGLVRLKRLKRANLSFNRFTSVPAIELPTLETLILSRNALNLVFSPTLSCPQMITAPRLQSLSLEYTGLEGSLYQLFYCMNGWYENTNTLNLAHNQLVLKKSDGATCNDEASSWSVTITSPFDHSHVTGGIRCCLMNCIDVLA
jgi:Leucine-rich repeat (LRR) protein